MQKAININVTDYKIFNGRNVGKIIIYENKEKVKEYDLSQLIFDGEYLNNKRNGKGKGFNNGYVLFEGEYLNGERSGKGKEYNKNTLIFEGEYLNGKRWNGKRYDEFRNIVYELNDGKGLVKEYDNNGDLIFEGEYLNGERNGKGKEYSNDKLIFEGE